MDESTRLINALRVFHESLGDDVFSYLNMKSILKNRPLLERLRTNIEQSISHDYLPGFQFQNLGKFSWHLQHEQFYRRYLFGDSIPASHFVDHWIRRFLFPNRYHYVTEIAHALQQHAAQSRDIAKRFNLDSHSIGWLRSMKEWLCINDVDRGFCKTQKHATNWTALYPHSTNDTFMQWTRRTASYRNERHLGVPHNMWVIDNVIYSGGQLVGVADINKNAGTTNTGYIEVWKWLSNNDCPSPKRTLLTFVQPAAPDSWKAPDRHLKR